MLIKPGTNFLLPKALTQPYVIDSTRRDVGWVGAMKCNPKVSSFNIIFKVYGINSKYYCIA